MAVSKALGSYGNAVGVVTPLDHRLAHLGLLAKTGVGANAIRSGVFYDGVSNLVLGKANMSYDVVPFTAALSRSPGQGAVFLANDGIVNLPTTAAPGANSRIDVIYLWPREFSIDGVNSTPVLGVAQGTPASSPVAPAIPSGALELARAVIPAGVTATNSGVTITQTAPFTAMAGGLVCVRNVAERDAGVWSNGQQVLDLATSVIYTRLNGAWDASVEEYAVAITPNAGYTITGQQVRRNGRTITVAFQATKSTAWGVADNIGTLNIPSLRPVGRNVYGSGTDNGDGGLRVCQVQTGGQVFVQGANGRAGANLQICSVTYVTPNP